MPRMFERLKSIFTKPSARPVTGMKDVDLGGDNLPIAVSSLFAGLPLNRFIDFDSYLQAGSRKIWATWKACDLVAKSVMNTPRIITRGTSNKPVLIPDLEQLLKVPNIFETGPELIYKLVMHCKMTGNAYILKDSPGLNYKKPSALYSLNPKRVRIALNGVKTIKGYLYNANGQSIAIDPEEMIHIRLPHPNREWYGLGELEAGEPLFNERINTDTWSEKFWQNGASPSGILVCEDQVTDEKEWDRAKAKFHKQYGGVHNSGKVAWLTGKWKYEQLGLSAQEMQNIEAQRLSIENIFLMHGVPLSVAGIREAANFATSDVDNQRYREYTVFPQVKLIEDRLNADLIGDWGPDVRLKFNVSGLTNPGKVIADWMPLFDRGGITINELREKAGLERDDSNPLWNQTYINQGLVPLELAGIQDQGQGQAGQQANATVQRFIQTSLLGNGNGRA